MIVQKDCALQGACKYTYTYTHARTHTHIRTYTCTHHTHTYMYIFLYPPVWFDRSDAMVAVGSNVTITCRSNQKATLELAYDTEPEHNSRPILASSDGRSVSHHLVHVKEKDTGVIYCVGRVETPPFHDVAAFNLTLCKLYGCVMWTLYCTLTYIENISHNFNHVRRMGNKLRLKPRGVPVLQFFMYEVVLVRLVLRTTCPNS